MEVKILTPDDVSKAKELAWGFTSTAGGELLVGKLCDSHEALRARVSELEGENKNLQAGVMGYQDRCAAYESMHDEATSQLAALTAERDGLAKENAYLTENRAHFKVGDHVKLSRSNETGRIVKVYDRPARQWQTYLFKSDRYSGEEGLSEILDRDIAQFLGESTYAQP